MISTLYRRSRVRVLRALPRDHDWAGLRILLYHRVAPGRDALTVSPSRFRSQMLTLLDCGAEPVRLTEMLTGLEHRIEGRYIAITFDDGYADLLDHAIPVLRELRLPATVFLPTLIIDGLQTFHWYMNPRPRALSWTDVLALQDEGLLDFQAHSLSHPNLLQLDDRCAWAEIVRARVALETRLGRPVKAFAYPAGFHSNREIELVREAGYECAVTTNPGVNPGGEPVETLKRTVVHPADNDTLFRAKLDGLIDTADRLPEWLRRHRVLRAGQTVEPNAGEMADTRRMPDSLIVHVTSRFPLLRNTFVVNELDGLAALGLDVEVISLFRPESGIRHARAERWLPRILPRPSLARCVLDLAWWLRRRPTRLLAVAAGIVKSNILTLHRSRAGVAALLLGASYARSLRQRPHARLHAHFETPADTSWVVHRLGAFEYSFTVHTDDGIMVPSLRRNAREANFVVTPSHHTAKTIRDKVGDEVRVEVIRAALPVGEYPFRARTPPRRGAVRGICVAGLERFKGHELLLRALATPDLKRVTVDIVGDGPLRPRLETFAAKLGVGGRVRFQGARTEDDVKGFLAHAHLFALPSIVEKSGRVDNIPVALMEAMASGVPVIASRLAGIPELVIDGDTGILVRPSDVNDLIRAFRRALASPPELLEMTKRARQKVEQEFDLPANAERLAALLRNGPRSDVQAETAGPI